MREFGQYQHEPQPFQLEPKQPLTRRGHLEAQIEWGQMMENHLVAEKTALLARIAHIDGQIHGIEQNRLSLEGQISLLHEETVLVTPLKPEMSA